MGVLNCSLNCSSSVVPNVGLQEFPRSRVFFGDYAVSDLVAEQEAWYWLPPYNNYRASDEFKDAIREYGFYAFGKSSDSRLCAGQLEQTTLSVTD